MNYSKIFLIPVVLFLSACAGSEEEPDAVKDPTVEENGYLFTIYPDNIISEISPYIYGMNLRKEFSHTSEDYSTMVRLGGNRLTGYNWENNASNAGADWHH